MDPISLRILDICRGGWVLIWDLWSILEDEATSTEISKAVSILNRDGLLKREACAAGWRYTTSFPGVDIDAVHRRKA
jgi:hypothetical protein